MDGFQRMGERIRREPAVARAISGSYAVCTAFSGLHTEKTHPIHKLVHSPWPHVVVAWKACKEIYVCGFS